MLTNRRVKRTIFFKIPLLFFFCSMSCVYPVSASLQLDKVTQPSTAGSKIISISDTSSITATDHESKLGQLPIGINLDATNYYNPSVPFNDIMKTASKMLTYDVSGKDTTTVRRRGFTSKCTKIPGSSGCKHSLSQKAIEWASAI